ETGRPAPIWLAFVLAITLGHDAMYAPQASFFAELFPTRVRYSGASLASQLGSVSSGGLSPLIATALLARSGGKSWPVSLYMVALGLITVVSVWLTRGTHRQGIGDWGRARRCSSPVRLVGGPGGIRTHNPRHRSTTTYTATT